MDRFKVILIGGDPAKRAAKRIGEFDYLCNLPFSVSSFVNPSSSNHFQLINCGYDWHDLPVFDTLQKAVESDGKVNSVGLYFNAKHVLNWVKEVCKYSTIKNIVIFAEDVPEADQKEIVSLARENKINVIGPSSTGIIVAGKGRLGEIAGEFKNLQLCKLDQPGSVGLVTKSGTMAGELMWVISQNSSGISTTVQIGGDAFPATDFVHWLEYFERETSIKTVVMSGEAGGDLEERAAQWYGKNKPHYKLIAVISGKFLEQMPKGQKFGHAGAKQEESGFGSAVHKVKVLLEAGVDVVEFEQLGKELRKLKNQ